MFAHVWNQLPHERQTLDIKGKFTASCGVAGSQAATGKEPRFSVHICSRHSIIHSTQATHFLPTSSTNDRCCIVKSDDPRNPTTRTATARFSYVAMPLSDVQEMTHSTGGNISEGASLAAKVHLHRFRKPLGAVSGCETTVDFSVRVRCPDVGTNRTGLLRQSNKATGSVCGASSRSWDTRVRPPMIVNTRGLPQYVGGFPRSNRRSADRQFRPASAYALCSRSWIVR